MTASFTGRWGWPVVLAALVVLAAVVRLHDLATRATWDADQGRDMIILAGMLHIHQPVLPLLGPVTSFGDFHHGAIWYYLLAPAAFVGGGDPTVVVAEIALLGSAAVGIVASLARSVAGPVAGIAAGLLMALSASAINESTFFWNPNLVAFFSALAVWAAWRAWTTRNVRWWLVAAGAQAVSMQCHVLGVILLPPLIVWFIADARRRTGPERRALGWAAVGSVIVVAVCYLPFIVSELQTGFGETRGLIAFVTGGGASAGAAGGQGLAFRLIFIPLRALSWPLTGLLTDALPLGFAAGVAVIVILVWLWRAAAPEMRPLTRWLGAATLWSCLALVIAAPSLEFVTPLPVDHYHAFLDPLVFVAVGIGFGVLLSRADAIPGALSIRATAVVIGVLLLVWNVVHWPPNVAPDGGYPAAEAAAARVKTDLIGYGAQVISLPSFKTAEAYTYPLRRVGADATEKWFRVADSVVILCDSLFVPDCGGPAEDGYRGQGFQLVDRFTAAPGRTISVYREAP